MSQIFSALHLLDFPADRPPSIAPQSLLNPVQLARDEHDISALREWIAGAIKLMEQERADRLAAEERALRAEKALGRYLRCGHRD